MGTYLIVPNTLKKAQQKYSSLLKIRYTVCQMQGWRRSMEDAFICNLEIGDGNSLFAIFDGHGGCQISKLAQKKFQQMLIENRNYRQQKYHSALFETFKNFDSFANSEIGEKELFQIRSNFSLDKGHYQQKISESTGCTANVVLITQKSIIIANAGDSRSVLATNFESFALSIDHKPSLPQQQKRIIKAGGQIANGRINGGLNLSRGFGDFIYKDQSLNYDQQLVTCKPDLKQINRTNKDEFILMGCDGIWQKYNQNYDQIIKRIRNQKVNGLNPIDILKNLFDNLLAKQLTDEVGCDNMTAILIQFL